MSVGYLLNHLYTACTVLCFAMLLLFALFFNSFVVFFFFKQKTAYEI